MLLDSSAVDINECEPISESGCAQGCENIPGSYSCQCNSGYVLGEDQHSCDGEALWPLIIATS